MDKNKKEDVGGQSLRKVSLLNNWVWAL